MTVLDLSAFAPPEEHPDVTALKKKVVATMKKYTDKNGWCDEARRAMVEAGVLDERQNTRLVINVTLKQGFDCSPSIVVHDLIGKDEDGQKEVLAKAIGDLSLRSSAQGVVGSLTVTADDIVTMTLPPAPQPGWRKATDQGRVLHYFTEDAIRLAADGRGHWVYPLCGIEAHSRCVRDAHPALTDHCKNCERDLARNA